MKKLLIVVLLFCTTIGFGTVNTALVPSHHTLETQTSLVYICNSTNAYAYHDHYCQGLNRCTHSISKVSINTAISKGYKPCGYCY